MAFGTDQSESDETEGKFPTTEAEEIGKYSCSHCSQTFRRKDALDRHVFHHTNIKKFKCKLCVKSYTNSSHLRRHMKTHEANVLPNGVRCLEPSCPARFTTADNMRRHFKLIHTDPTVYKCQLCTLVFRRKRQLRTHVATHTGVYPYRCEKENCNRGCMTLKELQNHRASHEYKCDICGREYQHWSALVAHRKIGHQTSYPCTVCSKTFYSKQNLKHHMKIHNADREVFACTYEMCSKFYLAKKNLDAHVRSKHEGKRLICDFCGRGLVTKQKMAHHLKLHVQEGKRKKVCLIAERKPRKDRGKPATSTALKLTGMASLPAAVHKAFARKDKDVEFIIPDVIPDSSEAESIF